ncbi:hypothetical protein VTI28DRAFT_1260 [Corynascus sepedonium]
MTAQGNAISQGVQVYNGHVQQLTTELARCGNFPVAQMQQQLAAIDQSLGKIHAEMFNFRALLQNGHVRTATTPLVGMRSVQAGPNPHIPVGQPIPNFPATPDHITQMTALECRTLLESLDWPYPQGQLPTRELRTAVRAAVGLPPL